MPAVIAMIAACVAPLFLNFAIPGVVPIQMKALADMAAWFMTFYFVNKLLKDLRP